MSQWPKNPLLQLLILEIAKAIVSFLVKKWGLDTEDGESSAKEEIIAILQENIKKEVAR